MPKYEDLPHYLYEDYLTWEGRWELIEGIPFSMQPSPTFRHQQISQKIAWLLDVAMEHCDVCQAVLPVDWKVSENTVVQPDNSVICYEPEGSFLTKAPSMIFEVLSPSTAAKDRGIKHSIYEREGVKYYCLVDPENEVVKVFELVQGRLVKKVDVTKESVDFDLGVCEFTLDFSRIW